MSPRSIVVLLIVLSTPMRGAAQEITEARRAFDRGVAALDEGRFAEAASALEESARLRASPVVFYNLGIAYRGEGRLNDAITAFERYVANPAANARRDEVAAVQRTISTLRDSLVRLRVDLVPASADLRIDGRTVALTDGGVQLDPGEHVIEATAPSHRVFRRQRTFRAGERESMEIRLELEPVNSRLVVGVRVAGAIVRVDGRRQPLGRVDLQIDPGSHHVVINATGYAPYEHDVLVPTGGTLRIDPTLDRSTPRWVLPTAVAGGVVVAAGAVIAAVVVSASGTAPPVSPSLGVVTE